MKNKIAVLSALNVAAALMLNAAHAGGEGSTVRGGGSTVVTGTSAQIASLMTGGVCGSWKTAEEMVAESSIFNDVIASIAQFDWYFALSLRQELNKLRFCMTDIPEALQTARARRSQGPARRNTNRDPNESIIEQAFALGIHPRERLNAYRDGYVVYIDQPDFDALPRDTMAKAALLIHEAGHGFFEASLTWAQRQQRLRSLDVLIDRAHNGAVSGRAEFHLSLQGNHVRFPRTVAQLDAVRAQVEFVLAAPEQQRALVLASAAPEVLITFDADAVRSLLADEHRGFVYPGTILENTVADIMTMGSPADFQAMLTKQYSQIEPFSLALSVLSNLSVEKRVALFASPLLQQNVDAALQQLIQAPVEMREMRIVGGPILQGIGAVVVNQEYAPITSLVPRSLEGMQSQQSLPRVLMASAQVLAEMVKDNNWELVRSMYTNNEDFYTALGLKNQIAAVSSMSPPVARERALALSVLGDLREGLVDQYFSVVRELLAINGMSDRYQVLIRLVQSRNFRSSREAL